MDNRKSAETLDYLEYLISKKAKLEKILRLLCLKSQVETGLNASTLDYIKKEILQVYGFDQMLLLSNLEKAELLKKDTGRDIWFEINRVTLLLLEQMCLNFLLLLLGVKFSERRSEIKPSKRRCLCLWWLLLDLVIWV